MAKEKHKGEVSGQPEKLPAHKDSFIKPEVVKNSGVLPVVGTSYIEAEHVPWLASEGITDVISLERLRPGTVEQLGDNNISHHYFPVIDADEGPYFREVDGEHLVELVQQIQHKKGARILIHCQEGKGRTPEAMRILEKAADKLQ